MIIILCVYETRRWIAEGELLDEARFCVHASFPLRGHKITIISLEAPDDDTCNDQVPTRDGIP